MRRAVSVVEVAEPAVWAELAAVAPIDAHLGEWLDARRRVAAPTFVRDAAPRLAAAGSPVLVRFARRDPAQVAAATAERAATVAALPERARRVLHAAQRHAVDGVVLGRHAWDPENDAEAVRILRGARLIDEVPGDAAPPYAGRYRLDPDLPPAVVPWDFTDAAMDLTDDLDPARPGPVALLHDLASLAAAVEHVRPKRTHAGTIAKADAKKLGVRLGVALTDLEGDARWGRALRGLEALRVVSMDPITREIALDLGLETTLSGDTPDAVDHLAHRLIEPDLHGVLPAVRRALADAGVGAVDEVVFLEILRERHRDVIFPGWRRGGAVYYPIIDGETPRPYDDDGFEHTEAPMIGALLGKLSRLGLIRRASGVFAATDDGRVWAGVTTTPRPPVWVSSDLEVLVPPDAVTPWERLRIERLGRCLARDVVDRYRLERRGVETWLSTHDIDDAIALLRRRCPGVPAVVEETLRSWARSAMRVVITHGVVLD